MKNNAPLWIVSLGQGGGDAAAVGGPGAPDIQNPDGGTVIEFLAGEEGAAGPTLAYGAWIEPEGPTVTVVSDDPTVGGEVILSGTEPFTDYVVTIYGVNVAGRGKTASTNPFQLNYTDAVGGSKSIVTNYNGTGETWAVHRITTDNDTFTVKTLIDPFDYMLAGAGGGRSDRGGTGGQWKESKAVEIQPGDYNVRVGRVVNDRPSGSTSFNGESCSSAGQNYGKGKASSITGTQIWYCGHGTGCCGGGVVDGCGNCQGEGNNVCCSHGKDQGGGWGGCCGGGDGYGCGYAGGARSSGSGAGSGGGVCGTWGNGAGGVVIVAYKCDPGLATLRSSDVWDEARFAEWRERYDAGLVNDLDEPIQQVNPGPVSSGDDEMDAAVEDAFDE